MIDERSIANKLMTEVDGIACDTVTRNQMIGIIQEITGPLKERIAGLESDLDKRNQATKVWIDSDTQTRAYANRLKRAIETCNAGLERNANREQPYGGFHTVQEEFAAIQSRLHRMIDPNAEHNNVSEDKQ